MERDDIYYKLVEEEIRGWPEWKRTCGSIGYRYVEWRKVRPQERIGSSGFKENQE